MLSERAATIWIRFVIVLYFVIGPLIAGFGIFSLFTLNQTDFMLYNTWPVSKVVFAFYHFGYGLFLLAVAIGFSKRWRPIWLVFLVLSLPEHFTWLLSVQFPWNLVILLVELFAWLMTLLSGRLFNR